MTAAEQEKFVRELAKDVTEAICEKIRAGKIPADWDGFELRMLLADKFAHEAHRVDLRAADKRKYKTEVAKNNL